MKKPLLCLMLISQAICGFAQIGVYNGKPRYQIEARRSGSTIGNMIVEMYPTIAPKHVRNFDSLVSILFYDTTAFHRVIPGFVIQGGDPNSRHGPRSTWGFGDPSQQTVPAEFNAISHIRGVFSAARSSNPNSATSQFFVCVAAATSLDGQYSAYGRVVSGMNIADTIVFAPRDGNDNPFTKIEMFVTRVDDDTASISAPVIIQPADSAIDITKNYLFKWNAVTGAQLYHFEVSKSPSFDTIVFSKSQSGTQLKVNVLNIGTVRYYWRVRTDNGGFISAYTPVRTFTTTPLTGVDQKKNGQFAVYPNPAKDEIRIDAPETSNGTYEFEVFNSNVSKVFTTAIRNIDQYSLNVAEFPAGLYFYTLKNYKETYSGKFSVVR